MKLLHFGKVKDGKLSLNNQIQFGREIKAFEGKEVVIAIEKKSRKKSVQQLRYYFGVMVTMVWQRFIDLGNQVTKEVVHEILKHKFLQGEIVNPATSELMTYTKSMAELTVTEAMDYYAAIQKWAAEDLEIYIPDPNEFIDQHEKEAA